MVPSARAASSVTVIVPVLNDDAVLDALLSQLQPWALRCVVVDGTPSAETAALVARHGQCYVHGQRGRGAQIATGCAATDSDWLWVLHADSCVDQPLVAALLAVCGGPPAWGRCDVRIPGLAMVAWFMNRRSRWTGICTGDQAMFFHRSLLDDVGGFPVQPLMEDVELSRRLKRAHGDAFRPLKVAVGTSPRRWRRQGVVRTVLRMWWYRTRYFCGADPVALYQAYYGTTR